MSQPTPDLSQDMAAMLAAAGITVTEEGRRRARAQLDAAAGERNQEKRAALRQRLGLPATPSRRRTAA